MSAASWMFEDQVTLFDSAYYVLRSLLVMKYLTSVQGSDNCGVLTWVLTILGIGW